MNNFFPTYLDENSGTTPAMILRKLSINVNREKDIFEKLCDLKLAVIPYDDALKAVGLKDEEFFFTNIMKKFERHQIAIVRTKIGLTTLDNNYVRLCDEASPIFIIEAIDERINQCWETAKTPIPTYSNLINSEIGIEHATLSVASETDFNNAYSAKIESESENMKVLTIPITKNDNFVFTSTSIQFLNDLFIKRIRAIFAEGVVLPIIASTLDLNDSLQHIKRQTDSDDIFQWYNIVKQLYEGLATLHSKQTLTAYTDLFDYIIILFHSLKSKVSKIDETKNIKLQVEEYIKSSFERLANFKEGLSQTELDNLLTEELQATKIPESHYEKTLDEFKKVHIVSSENSKNANFSQTDCCIQLDNIYIHSGLLLNLISNNYSKLSHTLAQHYQDLLYKHLTSKLSHKDNVFLSEDTLQISIHQLVHELDPIYYKLLKSPILLASLLSKKTKSQSMGEINSMQPSRKLMLFFNLKTKEMLPWHEIFNIRLAITLDQAYKRLNVFIRAWLFMTGRHRNMMKRIDQVQKTSSMMFGSLEERDLNKNNILIKKKKKK